MIDNGAHIVLIRPDIVNALRLEWKQLWKLWMINVAMKDEKKEKKIKPVLLSECLPLALNFR